MPKTPVSALSKAMAFLAARPFSEMELLTKLRRAGYSDSEADAAIEECRSRHYLDDELLAADCVEVLRQRNMGTRQIKLKLSRRGLDMETVSELLAQDPDAEKIAAKRAMESKLRLLKNETDPRKKQEKLFRFLAGRGFTAEVIFKVLNNEITDEYQ